MPEQLPSGFESLATSRAYFTQESMLAVETRKRKLFIGLPRETSLQENRLGLTPEAVQHLVSAGHEVVMEAGAGEPSKYADHAYSEAGAQIAYSTEEVFKADILLKVAPPTLEEIELLHAGQTLISALQMGSMTPEYIAALSRKKINAIGFELMKDPSGARPVVRAMSEIAGSTVMLIAAEYLARSNEGKGIILGGITGVPPSQVVILGAGTVAEYAARAATGLGAEVKVFDNHLYKLRRLKHNLGMQLYTSTLDTFALSQQIRRADVVIGALAVEDGRIPFMVPEEMVASMSPGSIIIDVSIDQGGCFETSEMTSHSNPVFRKYDVIHYSVPNIASRVPRTATNALSNIFTPILQEISQHGGINEVLFTNEHFRSGVYIYRGSLTNSMIAKKFNLRYKELGLLIAVRN
ncbi:MULTISPECIES: alanine dehydrogenase [Hymenobacter]|jgi:alanine dehydrogenase|uniref:alanine dehydrogenase n=2 Tax=Hymenobacter TaxID=89966 RepID=A0A931BAU2_9BACT|nr:MULTISPECIES: alanine dehydrogenase [Hymenobacter]MBF9140349.1 alanine dehydrogenase [Hymenobacter properus]MBR7719156.1 alanine dehydrogenase [Microvirga sp. SRT04]UOE32898.1 alanine dehydrogenase [Hymenobacter monticola]